MPVVRYLNSTVSASIATICHLIVHAVGIFGFAYYLGSVINRSVPYKYVLSGLLPFYQNDIPAKILTLATYVISVVLLFMTIISIYIVERKKEKINQLIAPVSSHQLIANGVIAIGIAVLAIRWRASNSLVELFISLWFANFLYPFCGALFRIIESRNRGKYERASQTAALLSIGIVSSAVMSICLMLIFSTPKVKNDFYNIPEKTIINHLAIDNHEFINTRHLFGLTKYDPRKEETSLSYDPRLSMVVPYTRELKYFLSSSDVVRSLPVAFDDRTGRLVVRAPLSDDNYKILFNIYTDPVIRSGLTSLYLRSQDIHSAEAHRYYSPFDIEFIKKNVWELDEQTVLGRYFYHHSYMMAPILAYTSGIKNFLSVYGIGYTKTYAKILEIFHSVNFQSYLKILYGAYLVYYLFFVLIAVAIFRRVEWVGLAAIGAALPIILQEPTTFLLAPGFSPGRHLWDLVVLFWGYRFLSTKSIKLLLLVFVATLIATWWNFQFGIFLFAAVAATCLVCEEYGSWRRRLFFLLILAIGQIAAVFLAGKDDNPLSKYMLMGFGSPGTPSIFILGTVCVLAVFGVMLLYCRIKLVGKNRFSHWCIAVGIYVYIAELMVYFIWNPAPNHFIGVISPWVVLFVSLLVFIWSENKNSDIDSATARQGLWTGIVTLFFVIPTIAVNSMDWQNLSQFYADHVLHTVEFPGAKFKTDMEPELFSESVAMINKYSPTDCIGMISKYDVILPMLSKKCLVGPYVTATDIFITQREGEQFANSLIKNAKVIYVDSDIDRSYIGEIPDESVTSRGFFSFDEGRGRAVMLSYLKGVFERLSDQYELISRGRLISAYRRKN